MNTESRNHLAEMIHMRNGATPLAAPARLPDMEALPPSLDDATEHRLQEFMAESAELVPALEAQLDSLQETFVSLMERHFEKERFRPGNRLHLFLSAEGKLVVEGDEEDTEQACAIFSRSPRLLRRFRDLARLAMLAHGIDVARMAHTAICTGSDADGEPFPGRYHMCLKGALSHFYVR
ncbi:hypothetical protein [uncultured Desulfovibrio sp.]|uniref:hypothetical protein n=1 Tax=uncultured Desulfovibrio sp. TaxID=167968 RepID=UPI0025EBB5FF|nr:hypothetical protein [uncultured Desulfovibrio sp.]